MLKDRPIVTLTVIFTITIALTVIVLPSAYYRVAHAQIINPKTLETFTASGLVGSLIFNNATKGQVGIKIHIS